MEVIVHKKITASSPGTQRRRSRGGHEQLLLSMYELPPTEEITLIDFEKLALKRLQLLKQIEACGAKNMSKEELHIHVREEAKKQSLTDTRTDLISHFILRLAYCKNEEMRRWFIGQEVQLFRIRFSQAPDKDIDNFLAEHDLKYQQINLKESQNLEIILRNFVGNQGINDYFAGCFKVPFLHALELINMRRVYLKGGFAYVSRKHLVSIIAAEFRQRLSRELARTFRATQGLRHQDKRIGRLLSSLQYQQLGNVYKVNVVEGAVDIDQLPQLADKSFPLCMQNLHTNLRSESHLKHGGRMQYGLFLKGIGLTLQDALTFWRNSFARKTDGDKFNKEYAYNIRHNYGKEGKRMSYTPYGCMKIIKETPAGGDHHGCPFRHFEADNLRAKLRERKIGNNEINELIQMVEDKHYQVACQKYFSLTHGGTQGLTVGNHPNAYFDDSVAYYKHIEKEKGGLGVGESSNNTTNNNNTAQSSSSSSSNSSGMETDGGGSVGVKREREVDGDGDTAM